MKRRNKKKPVTLSDYAQWMKDFGVDADFSELADGWKAALQEAYDSLKTYESPFGPIDYIQKPFYSRTLKIQRKNGVVETHIIFSDGSILDCDIHLTKLNKGDMVIQ